MGWVRGGIRAVVLAPRHAHFAAQPAPAALAQATRSAALDRWRHADAATGAVTNAARRRARGALPLGLVTVRVKDRVGVRDRVRLRVRDRLRLRLRLRLRRGLRLGLG